MATTQSSPWHARLGAEGPGQDDEAEPLYREVLEVRRENLGDRHPDTLISMNNLGLLLQDNGHLAAAELLLCEALEGMRETLGNQHPSTLTVINALAQCAAEGQQ